MASQGTLYCVAIWKAIIASLIIFFKIVFFQNLIVGTQRVGTTHARAGLTGRAGLLCGAINHPMWGSARPYAIMLNEHRLRARCTIAKQQQ